MGLSSASSFREEESSSSLKSASPFWPDLPPVGCPQSLQGLADFIQNWCCCQRASSQGMKGSAASLPTLSPLLLWLLQRQHMKVHSSFHFKNKTDNLELWNLEINIYAEDFAKFTISQYIWTETIEKTYIVLKMVEQKVTKMGEKPTQKTNTSDFLSQR